MLSFNYSPANDCVAKISDETHPKKQSCNSFQGFKLYILSRVRDLMEAIFIDVLTIMFAIVLNLKGRKIEEQAGKLEIYP